jgi:RNA polymerase sigma-70 factor (ECF subfamily)
MMPHGALWSTHPLDPVNPGSTNHTEYPTVSAGRTEDDSLIAVEAGAAEYQRIYQSQRTRILRLCRLLLADPDEADDVAQEIFLRFLRQHRLGGDRIAWGPWLTRVTVNACRDRRRSGWWKWWRQRHQEFEEADLPSHGLTPEQEVLGRETRQNVWRSFQQLSARQQEVFALRHIEEWSTEEVAEILGLSSGSIKRHLYRAVHQMRKTLGGSR